MEDNWIYIFFTLLLIDSMGAIIMSWFGQKWWMNATGSFAKHFPPAKGWAIVYFVLVLIIGYLLGVM
tara:strand:+ start:4052 stop:4252 length:201 start_codon:yes stop_codon:yes gene_type:complete